jgi:hypothetical protein
MSNEGHNIATGAQALGPMVLPYKAPTGSHNIAIGYMAGAWLTTGSGNILIGNHAGEELTTEDGCVIIGDDIRSLDPEHTHNATFIGVEPSRFIVGETVFGRPCNLREIVTGLVAGRASHIDG